MFFKLSLSALSSGYRKNKIVVLASAFVLMATAHSFVIANSFALSGYWDDTILFVGWIDAAPSNPVHGIPWILNQTRHPDLTPNLILPLLYVLQVSGLLSNWMLILLCNLALVALFVFLTRIAIKLGSPTEASFLSAFLLYFAPVLIEQRSWFVAMQHTFTVFFLMTGCYVTFNLATRIDLTVRKLLFWVGLLDLTLILIGLGREIGIPVSLLVILILSIVRPQYWKVLLVGWTIPLILLLHRLASGYSGSQIEYSFKEVSGIARTYLDGIMNRVAPTQLIVLCLAVVPTVQAALFIRNRNVSASGEELVAVPKSAFSIKTVGVPFAIWLLFLQVPSVGTPFMSLVPPFWAVGREKIALARWSTFEFDISTFHLIVLLTIVTVLIINSARLNYFLAISVTCTAPYLAVGDNREKFWDLESTSLSRYSIYFLPLAYLLLLELARWLRSQDFWSIQISLSFVFVTTVFWIAPQALGLNDLLYNRAREYSSISVETCGSKSYIVVSEQYAIFLKRGYGEILEKPWDALLKDERLKSDLPNVSLKVYSNDELFKLCRDLHDLSIESQINNLDSLVSGETQTRLDTLRSSLKSQSKENLSAELNEILGEVVRTSNLLEE